MRPVALLRKVAPMHRKRFLGAITADGKTVYVANQQSGNVVPISTATNTAGAAISVGPRPNGIAVTPDGSTVYVTMSSGTTIVPISTATNAAGSPITVGNSPA